jgi:ParB-like chromosome segregation protein Spo0J
MANKQQPEVSVKTYIEKIDKLIANDANPRKISREAYEKLKKSLKDFPEMKQLREIVVDENLQILGGHQRIYALKDLGYQDVTVKQVFGLTDKQKREFMIKDNTASGTWDTDILANQFDLAELKNWGVPDFGDLGGEKEKEKPTGGDRECLCPACGYQGPADEFNPNTNN